MSTTLLYKYRKVDEHTLSIFINDEVYFSSVESFNDPFDGQLNLFDGLKAFVENSEELKFPDDDSRIKTICDDANKELADTGVFSVSSTKCQILMWSHYADHHKGICIGFSVEGLMEEFGSARHPTSYDMLYDKSKPFVRLLEQDKASELPPFGFLEPDVFRILVEYKHKDWDYEQEVRFLRKLVGPAKINPNNIKSVIYGIRTPKKHKKLINNLLHSRNEYAHVKEYQMKRIPGALEIIDEEACSSDFEVDGDGREFRCSKEET